MNKSLVQSIIEKDEREQKSRRGTFKRQMPKMHRNDTCLCGSGLKFKRCCGRK